MGTVLFLNCHSFIVLNLVWEKEILNSPIIIVLVTMFLTPGQH